MMCCISAGSTHEGMKWLPSAAVAGAVLLKQGNPQMNATTNVLGVLIKTGSTEVKECLNLLCHLFPFVYI